MSGMLAMEATAGVRDSLSGLFRAGQTGVSSEKQRVGQPQPPQQVADWGSTPRTPEGQPAGLSGLRVDHADSVTHSHGPWLAPGRVWPQLALRGLSSAGGYRGLNGSPGVLPGYRAEEGPVRNADGSCDIRPTKASSSARLHGRPATRRVPLTENCKHEPIQLALALTLAAKRRTYANRFVQGRAGWARR